VDAPPLSAPLDVGFDYTRSLGPVLGRFMTGLRDGRVLGGRTADGRIHVPPLEYDPVTHDPVTELVEVATTGTVTSWTWTDRPLDGQPLDRPFGWALIRLDGADTALLHAVDAGQRSQMRTGMRVSIRWAASRSGHIRDIECFEPAGVSAPALESDEDPVTIMTTPIRLAYTHTTSPEESRYLLALAEGQRRFQGRRQLSQVIEAGATMLLLGVTLGQSLRAVGLESQLYAVLLCGQALALLGYGVLRKLRVPFFGGAAFFVAGVLWLSVDPLMAANKWVLLGILGLLLVGVYVLLERRQEQLARAGRAWVERVSGWG